MSVCIYRHIHLRSHFCKTDINFKMEPVFECRYRSILVSEHGSLENRKDGKQVASTVHREWLGRGNSMHAQLSPMGTHTNTRAHARTLL